MSQDADRCIAVDENARIIGCDLLTAWLSTGFLEANPGSAVVYDLRSTKSLPEIITETGGKAIKSRVGHVFMKQKMAEHNAVFGGELSGHFYFRDNYFADSGAIAFATTVSALARAEGSMSEQIRPARRYVQSGEINFETDDKDAAIDALVDAFPSADIEELDGVTLDLGDWWFNVRSSNTEPLMRLNLEGPDDSTVSAYLEQVAGHLGRRVGR